MLVIIIWLCWYSSTIAKLLRGFLSKNRTGTWRTSNESWHLLEDIAVHFPLPNGPSAASYSDYPLVIETDSSEPFPARPNIRCPRLSHKKRCTPQSNIIYNRNIYRKCFSIAMYKIQDRWQVTRILNFSMTQLSL